MYRILYPLSLVLLMNAAYARESRPGESFKQTIKKAIIVDESKIDPVGSKIIARGEGHELQGNCEKRLENGDCEEISFVLTYQNQKLAMVQKDTDRPFKIDIIGLKDDLNQKYLESLWRFEDFSKPIRQAGDFTGYVGASCIFDRSTCGLLLLLPLTIAGDIALLPIDIARNRIPQALARKRAKKLVKGLSFPSEEEKVVSDKQFFKTFENFSRVKD